MMAFDRPNRLSPVRLEHAGLRTTRLEAMVDWYCNVLDADIAFRSPTIAFLRYDERNHRLVIVARAQLVDKPANSAGLDHLAFAYGGADDLGRAFRRLCDLGIEPQRSTDHGSSLSLYYSDPDGNQIELKVDTFTSDEEQVAWLSSPQFAANPLGTPFDPRTRFAHAASLRQGKHDGLHGLA
jgi:catechol-2,3-dioxygenase